ncbi:MAG: alpha/beta hydrolase [Nostocaceae cyanobacterium]|nr:alpha/beta hydrolase [Nostocaceae cyanobacterium]
MNSKIADWIRNQLWHNPPMAGAIATVTAVLVGVVVSRTLPHGSATATQALTLMVVGLLLGGIAGLVMRSPWAMVLATTAYIFTIEIGQLYTAGPTVGAIRLDEAFGILAFLLGRGFHGLVGVLPMILGANLGVAIALHLSRDRLPNHTSNQPSWWIITGMLALGLLVFALVIARPATTPPILTAEGKPVPGSIASLEKVQLGGQEQWIMLRGYSTEKPVLLYLSGGPGQSDLPFVRVLLDDLTRDFVVVGWDQRGTGKSYAAIDPTSSLTLSQAVADTLELTNYLRQRFDENKIYLLGESWGSTLGVLAVQRRPDWYYAWIGSGQMVSQRETDRRLYHDILALASETADTTLAGKMRAYGEPPYADIPYAYAFVMTQYDRLYKPYTPPRAYIQRAEAANLGLWGVLGSEYNLVEKVNVLRGLIDTFSILYPQLQDIDFRKSVKQLEVPVYLLDGAAELAARRDLALEWFEQLQAPQKQMFTFENAAHSVVFEQFEAFSRMMSETILPQTYPQL